MNRRNFAKGAAWTVPAISIAAAAPMIAASTGFPTRVTGWACKMPGNSGAIKHGYRVVLTITPEPQTVVPVQVVLGNGRYAQIVGDAHRTSDGWTFATYWLDEQDLAALR